MSGPAGDGVTIAPPDRTTGSSAAWTARRVELWEQLSELFLRAGFRNLTIGDLAARLSCSRRTLYSLAESRDELVRGVVEHLFDRQLRAAGDAADAAEPGVDAVMAQLSRGVLALDAGAPFVDELRARPATAAMLASYRERERAALAATVTRGVDAGRLATDRPEIVADVLDAAAERLAWRRAVNGSPSVDDALDALDALVRRWLTVP